MSCFSQLEQMVHLCGASGDHGHVPVTCGVLGDRVGSPQITQCLVNTVIRTFWVLREYLNE